MNYTRNEIYYRNKYLEENCRCLFCNFDSQGCQNEVSDNTTVAHYIRKIFKDRGHAAIRNHLPILTF